MAPVTFAKTPATVPATQPGTASTQPGASRFPTPAELIEKLKATTQEKANLIQVAYIDLSTPITEAPEDFSWFGGPGGDTLHTLQTRLKDARDDETIKAVLITLGGTAMSLAQAQELRETLTDLNDAGKKTFVYADGYDTVTYTLASGATDVCVLAGGELMMPGVGIETMFYKGLFDKVGVKADYVQIGEFKGAEEPFTRTAASDSLRGELNRLTDALYTQIVDGIATHRKLPVDKVRDAIDGALISATRAKDIGLVDHLTDLDDLRDLLTESLGGDINLLHDYGAEEKPEIDFSNPFGFLALLGQRPEVSDKPQIAVIYADGMIVDGEAAGGLFEEGGQVGSANIRRAVRIASRDDNIEAVVIRINSPGGSALASEVMWQSVRRLNKDKPVIISIGSMAASGGYYLASAGDVIFADPSAIVGSIGVVGGKFVLKDLYDKLGLTTESYLKGGNADLFSSNTPFNDAQRKMLTRWMTDTYDQFTSRIMETRKDKITDIDKVARGRIFLASDAKALGMIDEIGGLPDAIALAASKVELKDGEFDIRVVPAPRSISDILRGEEPEASTPTRGTQRTPGVTGPDLRVHARIDMPQSPLLAALNMVTDSAGKKLLGQQLMVMQLLQQRPVVLVAPFVVHIR